MEHEPLSIRTRLEWVQPVEPWVRLLEPGVLVEVTGGAFRGFVGRIVPDAYPERSPFMVAVQAEETVKIDS